MIDWVDNFDKKYGLLLDVVLTKHNGLYKRRNGFKLIFSLLLSIKKENFLILETGTLRNPDNWTDGQSAFLFTEFVDHFNGNVISVDIDEDACRSAKSFISSKRFSVTCADSLEWIPKQPLENVDLFYLDSYDVSWKKNQTDHLSSEHHLKEFLLIEPYLTANKIVVIDDNAFFDNERKGKGSKIFEYLKNKGKLPLYDEYQIIYKF
jgi:hypothetical protein